MANVTLPPWLDVGPQNYVAAAEAGARIGEETANRREQARQFADTMMFKRDEAQQQNAIAGAELQLRAQDTKLKTVTLLQNLKQQNLDNQLRLDKQQHDQNMAEQKLALDRQAQQQTHDINVGKLQVQQQRFQIADQQYAQKFAAQQEAARRIQSGEDPATVYLQLGAQLGESGTALASLAHQTRAPQDIPEASVEEFDGEKFLKSYRHDGTPVYQKMGQGGSAADDKRIGHLRALIHDMTTGGILTNPEDKKLLQSYRDELHRLLGLDQGGGAGVGPSGISGIVNIRGAAPRAHTEEQDYTPAGYQDEPGATEAEPPQEQPTGRVRAPGDAAYEQYINLPM